MTNLNREKIGFIILSLLVLVLIAFLGNLIVTYQPSVRDEDFEANLANSLQELNLNSLEVRTKNDQINIFYEAGLSLPKYEDVARAEFQEILNVTKNLVDKNYPYKTIKIRSTYNGFLHETPYYEEEFDLN